jgi:sodium pump decarboxylase gamma subunit
MLIEGLKLTLMGVTVVYIFLLLLAYSTNVVYWFLKKDTLLEETEKKEAQKKQKKEVQPQGSKGTILAVITGAIAAHREKQKIGNL